MEVRMRKSLLFFSVIVFFCFVFYQNNDCQQKKTLCDLEVHVLTANTLGGVGAGNRQCLGHSVSEQPLSWGCTDWWISLYSHRVTGLDLKKQTQKPAKPPLWNISSHLISYLPCSWGQVPSLCTQTWAANHPECLQLWEPPGIMPTVCQTLSKS